MAVQPGEEIQKERSDYQSDKLFYWLSAMSHEIRTPLNAIVGFSGLLMEGRVTDEEQEEFSRLINRNSRRLLEIISNLTDLARIEAGSIKFYPGPTSVHRMMDDLEKEAQEISLMYGESASQTIFTNKYNTRKLFLLDWPRLFQVLIILLDNSIKFSDGGAVQVTLTKTEANHIQFIISDNGPGMDEETLRDLFDLFPYESTEKNVKIKSRGLGMVLVQKMCELMGITLDTKSKPGKGSTFTLTLPQLAQVSSASDAGQALGLHPSF